LSERDGVRVLYTAADAAGVDGDVKGDVDVDEDVTVLKYVDERVNGGVGIDADKMLILSLMLLLFKSAIVYSVGDAKNKSRRKKKHNEY
jgi:hypothetical protein